MKVLHIWMLVALCACKHTPKKPSKVAEQDTSKELEIAKLTLVDHSDTLGGYEIYVREKIPNADLYCTEICSGIDFASCTKDTCTSNFSVFIKRLPAGPAKIKIQACSYLERGKSPTISCGNAQSISIANAKPLSAAMAKNLANLKILEHQIDALSDKIYADVYAINSPADQKFIESIRPYVLSISPATLNSLFKESYLNGLADMQNELEKAELKDQKDLNGSKSEDSPIKNAISSRGLFAGMALFWVLKNADWGERNILQEDLIRAENTVMSQLNSGSLPSLSFLSAKSDDGDLSLVKMEPTNDRLKQLERRLAMLVTPPLQPQPLPSAAIISQHFDALTQVTGDNSRDWLQYEIPESIFDFTNAETQFDQAYNTRKAALQPTKLANLAANFRLDDFYFRVKSKFADLAGNWDLGDKYKVESKLRHAYYYGLYVQSMHATAIYSSPELARNITLYARAKAEYEGYTKKNSIDLELRALFDAATDTARANANTHWEVYSNYNIGAQAISKLKSILPSFQKENLLPEELRRGIAEHRRKFPDYNDLPDKPISTKPTAEQTKYYTKMRLFDGIFVGASTLLAYRGIKEFKAGQGKSGLWALLAFVAVEAQRIRPFTLSITGSDSIYLKLERMLDLLIERKQLFDRIDANPNSKP